MFYVCIVLPRFSPSLYRSFLLNLRFGESRVQWKWVNVIIHSRIKQTIYVIYIWLKFLFLIHLSRLSSAQVVCCSAGTINLLKYNTKKQTNKWCEQQQPTVYDFNSSILRVREWLWHYCKDWLQRILNVFNTTHEASWKKGCGFQYYPFRRPQLFQKSILISNGRVVFMLLWQPTKLDIHSILRNCNPIVIVDVY